MVLFLARARDFSRPKRPDRRWNQTQPLIQEEPMFLLPEVKWPRCEADRSQPSRTEVMNAWSYTSTPHTPSWYTQRQLHFAFFLAELRTFNAIGGRKGQSVRPHISDPKSLNGFK